MIKKYLILITIMTSVFYTGCLKPSPKRPSAQDILMMQAALPAQEEKVEPVIEPEPEPELTPLQKCKKEEGKFNLIVNAPEGSRIRILNIKPIYKKCIALSSGKYHIEVSKKGYMKHREWITLDNDLELDVDLIEFLKGYKENRVVKKIKKINKNK